MGRLPQPPDLRRRLIVTPELAAVTGIVLVLPLASAFGAFRARSHAQSSTQSASLTVDYPSRALFHEDELLTADVTVNEACDAVLIFDRGYASHFEREAPAPVENTPTRIELGKLTKGETRHVEIAFSTRQAWLAEGNLSLSCDERPAASVRLSTLVFP